MKLPHEKIIYLITFFLFLILNFGCSKDSDLLTELVLTDSGLDDLVVKNLVVNDYIVAAPSDQIVLDVLSNDNFADTDEVKIVETSTPDNGIVLINEDKTLTYIPGVQSSEVVIVPAEESSLTEETATSEDPSATEEATPEENSVPEVTTAPQETLATEEATTETFTYTTEVINDDETVTVETGTVTVNITEAFDVLKAFPTAKGFGKNTTGGRGGAIYEVTNLNSSGQGSLAYGLENLSGPRTVIFKVGGIINHSGADYVNVKNGDVTIAGQTAPGDGILIRGELRISSSNVIVRHVRIRPGNEASGSNQACVRLVSYSGNTVSNVILDHVSMSWARDENLTITEAGGQSGKVENVTVQNSFITDNIDTGYNAILFQECYNISFYQNLFGFSTERNVRASDCGSNWEMINNYTYSYKDAALGTYQNHVDIIGNRWDTGGESQYSTHIFNLSASSNNCPDAQNSLSRVYYEDNLKNGGAGTYGSAAIAAKQGGRVLGSDIVPYAASLVKDKVLTNAGAYHNLPQGLDSFDSGRISDIIANRGQRMTSASYPADFPTISGGTAYADSDKDGMSDVWEESYGLNPNDASDGKKDINNDGYSNLEDFLYYLTIQN